MKYSRLLFGFFFLFLLFALFVSGSAESEDFSSSVTDGKTALSSLWEPLYFDQTELVWDAFTERFLWSVCPEDFPLSPVVRTAGFSDASLSFPQLLPGLEDLRQNPSVDFVLADDSQFYQGKVSITTLPVIRIFTEDFIGDEYVEGKIRIWDPAAKTLMESEALFKIRGGSTKVFDKKSYRISLKKPDYTKKRKESFLNMRKDDDWILYPAYNDPEKIRNVFCSNLWLESCGAKNSKGVRNGSEYKYAEVFINDDYRGLYALGSPTDNKEMFAENDEGVIFKKIDWSDEMAAIETDDPVLPGFEIYKATGKYEKDEDLCWKLLRDYYVFLRDNRQNSEALLERMDTENFIHTSIFLNLVQGRDNGADMMNIKNEYLCLTEEGDRIFSMMTPWDLDLTFGNGWVYDLDSNNTIPYFYLSDLNTPFLHGYLAQVLQNSDTDLAERIRKAYRDLREGPWSEEHISQLIDEYEKEIYGSGAYKRETERWPFCSSADPEKGLSIFRQFVLERLQACDLYYALP